MKKNRVFINLTSKLGSMAVFGTSALLVLFVLAAHTRSVAQTGSAANFPDRQVRIVVPFPAGGASDIVARLLLKSLAKPGSKPYWSKTNPAPLGTLGRNMLPTPSPMVTHSFLPT